MRKRGPCTLAPGAWGQRCRANVELVTRKFCRGCQGQAVVLTDSHCAGAVPLGHVKRVQVSRQLLARCMPAPDRAGPCLSPQCCIPGRLPVSKARLHYRAAQFDVMRPCARSEDAPTAEADCSKTAAGWRAQRHNSLRYSHQGASTAIAPQRIATTAYTTRRDRVVLHKCVPEALFRTYVYTRPAHYRHRADLEPRYTRRQLRLLASTKLSTRRPGPTQTSPCRKQSLASTPRPAFTGLWPRRLQQLQFITMPFMPSLCHVCRTQPTLHLHPQVHTEQGANA